MKFKIRKETFGDGMILYYPMVKKGFLGSWHYLHDDPGIIARLDGYKGLIKSYLKIGNAKKAIDSYKKSIHGNKIIEVKDILID